MAREFARLFYKSIAWQKCRKGYIAHRQAINGGLCETCHEKPGYIVHHKEELTPENINDPDVALGFGNLKYDCLECHNKENGRGRGNIAGLTDYAFGPDGDVMPITQEKGYTPPC